METVIQILPIGIILKIVNQMLIIQQILGRKVQMPATKEKLLLSQMLILNLPHLVAMNFKLVE